MGSGTDMAVVVRLQSRLSNCRQLAPYHTARNHSSVE